MNLIKSSAGRKLTFTFLYASEGAPIGFIWWALPTLLRTEGIEIDKITGLTAILVFPWIFKFIWAPLVDSLRTIKWGFKSWIIASQTMMGLFLIPVMFIDPKEEFIMLTILLIGHSFFAATQDVSVDALAINIVGSGERGSINGFMQAGMLLGRSLFGGGVLIAMNYLNNSTVFLLMILFIWSSLIFVLLIKEPESSLNKRKGFADFFPKFKKVITAKNTLLALLFALISASAFETAGALAGPFLIDHNISEKTVGLFYGIPVVILTLTGGLIGGRFSDRISRKKAVGIFLTGFVTVVIILAVLELFFSPVGSYIWITSFSLLYFFIGLFTASSYALFMDLTDPDLGATQFSTFMAGTNGCEAWSVWAAGLIISAAGYGTGFLVMCGVSLLSLLVLRRIKTK